MRELNPYDRFDRIHDAALACAKTRQGENRIEETEYHHGVAEPGYDDKPTVLGNWNKISKWHKDRSIDLDEAPARMAHALEAAGLSIEWSDEWTVCADCSKLVRSQPDSYSWTRAYWDDEDGYAHCERCTDKDDSEYLEWLEGHEDRAATFQVDLEAAGYKCLEDRLESGLYGGQDASPSKIAAALRKQGVERFIFSLDSVGQFDARFSLWVHSDDLEKLDRSKYDAANKRADVDPADALKRGLQGATVALSKLPVGPGVKMAKIGPDGTVEARLVSPEEFIEGIKD
jgi:hypothetical protein